MSILKSLKLTNAKPVRSSDNPVERARDKVIASLAEQKAMAEAKIAGQHFAPTHMVWRKDADGQRVQVETPMVKAGTVDKETPGTFDETCLSVPVELSPDDIKALREQNRVSQPVFARCQVAKMRFLPKA
jgi:hypothetical protein